MSIEIPDNWLGKPIQGSLEKILQGKPAKQPRKARVAPTQQPVIRPASLIADPQNWIILEGSNRQGYSYPDLVVSIYRLGVSPDVERAAQSLGLTVQNTATEKNGHEYIGNINWEEALKLNLALGYVMMTPRQGMDFMLDMKAAIPLKGNKTPKVLYDGAGQPIDPDCIKDLYNEMFQKRDPWRAEWLDAKFAKQGNSMRILYNHFLDSSGKLAFRNNDQVISCLEQDTAVSLTQLTAQGLPTQARDSGAFYFSYPRENAVARFNANSVWAGLNCSGDPTYRNPELGVRAARAKI